MTRRALRVALTALTLLALVLRLVPDAGGGLWLDEASSVLAALRPDPGRALLAAVIHDFHPPLYDVLLWGWLRLGHDLGWLRLLSVVMGTAAVPVTALVARRLWGSWAGGLAGLLLAVSPWQIYYSRELRMYALESLLAAGSLLSLLRAVERGRRRDWAIYSAVSVLFLLSDFFAAAAVLGQSIWLWRTLRAGERRRAAFAQLPLLATLVILVPVALSAAVQGAGSGAPAGGDRVLGLLADLGAGWSAQTPVAALAAFTLVAALGLAARGLRQQWGAGLLWLSAGVPVLLMGLGGVITHIWVERGLVFVSPAIAVLLGGALAGAAIELRQRAAAGWRPSPATLWPALAGLLLVIEVAGLGQLWAETYQRPPLQPVAQLLGAGERPAAVLSVDQVTGTPLVVRDLLAGVPADDWQAGATSRPTLDLVARRLAGLPGSGILDRAAGSAYRATDLDTAAWRLTYAEIPSWCRSHPAFWLVYQGAPPEHLLQPQLSFYRRFVPMRPGVDGGLARTMAAIPAAFTVDRLVQLDGTVLWHYRADPAGQGT